MTIDTKRWVKSCPLCPDKEFINRSALEEHLRNSYRHGWCEACDRLCHSRHSLALHLSSVHQYVLSATGTTFFDKSGQGNNHAVPHGHHLVQYTPPSSNSESTANREAHHDIVCFGCDRQFHSFASMMLHLEEGDCITSMSELGQMAEEFDGSDRYVAFGWRDYLRNEYGKGALAVDTDHETIWECVECRKGFFSLKQAKQHARSPAHKPLVFKCPGCFTFFSALSGLLQHVEQSDSCSEGLHKGTGVMGRLLITLEEQLHDKETNGLQEFSADSDRP